MIIFEEPIYFPFLPLMREPVANYQSAIFDARPDAMAGAKPSSTKITHSWRVSLCSNPASDSDSAR
jgi:hypothetical protein